MSFTRFCSAGFGPAKTGLGTVGYTITGGSRTTTGVAELAAGSGSYGALVTFPDAYKGKVVFDTGEVTPAYAVGTVNADDPQTLADASVTSAKFTVGTVNAAATGVLELLTLLVRRFFPVSGGSVTFPKSGTGNLLVKGSGGTPISTQSVSDDGVTQTLGPAS